MFDQFLIDNQTIDFRLYQFDSSSSISDNNFNLNASNDTNNIILDNHLLNINNLTLNYTKHDFETLKFIHYYVYEILGAIIFTLGIILNVLSFTYFQLSRSFKDTSMRYYFSVISITDSLRLIEWPVIILVDKKIIYLTSGLCKALLFITTISGLISIYALVILSIERYIILQFPFHGKAFYKIKTSIRILVLIIVIFIIINIPYLLPDIIRNSYSNYDIHLYMCNINLKFHIFMFINTILLYSIIPFVILLIFNTLLICLLSRQKRQQFILFILPNINAANFKRDKQFKEKTVLLIVVSFFLILTVSPRYILQMLLFFFRLPNLKSFAVTKCLIVLEMFNFSFNFFFYILCSKTSRHELYLIFYYFFYWKWFNKSKYCYCNICATQNFYPQISQQHSPHNQIVQQFAQQTEETAKSNQASAVSSTPLISGYRYNSRKNSSFKSNTLNRIDSAVIPSEREMSIIMDCQKPKSNYCKYSMIKSKLRKFSLSGPISEKHQFLDRNVNQDEQTYNNHNNTITLNDNSQCPNIHTKEQKLKMFLMRHSSSKLTARHASLKYKLNTA